MLARNATANQSHTATNVHLDDDPGPAMVRGRGSNHSKAQNKSNRAIQIARQSLRVYARRHECMCVCKHVYGWLSSRAPCGTHTTVAVERTTTQFHARGRFEKRQAPHTSCQSLRVYGKHECMCVCKHVYGWLWSPGAVRNTHDSGGRTNDNAIPCPRKI